MHKEQRTRWAESGSEAKLPGWFCFCFNSFLIHLFILVVLGLCSTHKLSLVVAARRGYSLVAVCRLLISVTSPVSENRL